eukprot:TRINITY_DN497_c0_g1_i1.p1 TRINITY_DN497_c0_g1~~TRINITY_DN497_c0_g1_i1.p1  ORF type:complete len:192 (-),score=56.11 TRINITY_DN497_c0_g1_i1:236-811(-)
MAFTLKELPWAKNALAPIISEETVEFHYGKHHAGYVTKLNGLVKDTPLASKTLEELVRTEKGKIFNLAAQIWNHTFYWDSLIPGGSAPSGALLEKINADFGSFDKFKQEMSDVANNHFGSGWAWLVKKADGKLAVYSTSDAANPMTQGDVPLLTCDVWEHAYYIDHRNNRATYVDNWWKIINWNFVAGNLQ